MIGVLLVSHGKMAEGVLDAAGMFVPDMPQAEAVSLSPSDSPEEFAARLREALGRVDTGDGAVILADLKGGTPCNQAALLTGERVRLLAGMNLALVMEVLLGREGAAGARELAESAMEMGKDAMADISALLGK